MASMHETAAMATTSEADSVASLIAGSQQRLQRHRSYHSQSRSSRRFDNSSKRFESSHHRRATSVRVRPTYIEADDDPNLPEPPVSIQVASPEDEEDSDTADNTLGHRLDAPAGGGARGRRRSLPRIPVYDPTLDDHDADTELYSPADEAPWSPMAGAASRPQNWTSPNHYNNYEQQRQQQHPVVMDQFDEFLYKSKHIGSSNGMLHLSGPPPEVNIEVPSDSDSSRRPSKYTISNASSTYDMQGNKKDVRRPSSGNVNGRGSRTSMQSHSADLLGARPMALDRRSSHTGLPARRPSVQQARCPSPRGGGGGGGGGHQAHAAMLVVPQGRQRGSSLPGNIEVVNQDDIYRLRNFSMAGKKVINRGDSVKARSNHSIASTNSSAEICNNSGISGSRTNSEDYSPGCSASSSRRASRGSRRASCRGGAGIETLAEDPPKQYRVAMLGACGVGKSALTSQFLSSDHMNTYDSVEDDVQKVVSVSVDGKESQLVFIDHAHSDMSVENQVATYTPDGYIVVFAVDDADSLDEAEEILSYLKSEELLLRQAVILVANKTDLVRSRVISTSSGKSLAIKYGCKYIETSPGINHNVDELLVGMLTQIQLRQQIKEQNVPNSQNSGGKRGFKVMDLLERVWKMQDSKSKSCGNLHVL